MKMKIFSAKLQVWWSKGYIQMHLHVPPPHVLSVKRELGIQDGWCMNFLLMPVLKLQVHHIPYIAPTWWTMALIKFCICKCKAIVNSHVKNIQKIRNVANECTCTFVPLEKNLLTKFDLHVCIFKNTKQWWLKKYMKIAWSWKIDVHVHKEINCFNSIVEAHKTFINV